MTNKKNILLVDDDLDQLEIVGLYVSKFGFNPIKIDNQKEAETYIENNKPDLAIFDLMMENEDSGFILSYKLKKKYPDVPVIIITAVASETGMSFGLDNETNKTWIKADLYLEKNIREDQLHREMKRLLN
ncbi:MAG: response regulator [Bacteroidales bacterium]|nr:response regulator [Bacteroidales bacterium]